MKKVYMFVNVDWFFLSHRISLAKNAFQNGIDMSVYADLTGIEAISKDDKYSLNQSPLSRSKKNFLSVVVEFIKVYLLIHKNKPDLIHAVTIKPIIFLGIVSRIIGIPFIGAVSGLGPVFNHETIFNRFRLRLVMAIYRYIFNSKSSAIICQNSHDKEVLQNFNIGRQASIITVPGSGVDLEEFKPIAINEKPPIILMACRILKEKGIYEFCSAAASFKTKNNVEARFILAGPIDSESPSAILERNLRSLCKKSGVEYVGDRKDMNLLIASASIFILPSYYSEGMPKVLLEAAACGVPVITTDHPGCRDAILNNETGILIKPHDSKVLYLAILSLLSNPDQLIEMGRSGRKLAEKCYDENKVREAHYLLYKKYLNEIL
ncbi:glycosyltransferase family 4 protein [Gammaproteobacteria bacterium]|nr:glycosyltransferase family 4 protein [Gammaproteobacteria bacterium]